MKLTFHVVLFTIAMCFYTTVFTHTAIYSIETSAAFQYAGSSLNESLIEIRVNPEVFGLNTSKKVMQFVKQPRSQVWPGGYSNPDPSPNIDFLSNYIIGT